MVLNDSEDIILYPDFKVWIMAAIEENANMTQTFSATSVGVNQSVTENGRICLCKLVYVKVFHIKLSIWTFFPTPLQNAS